MKFIRPSLVRLAYLLPIFMLLPFASVFAQNFNLLPPVESKNFPKVRVYYNANDIAGNPISGLTAADFDVKENNTVINPTVVTQRCSTIVDGPTLCIVLVLDKSYSMARIVDGTNTSRFDFVKSAAKDFVNGLDYKKKTSVAVVSFDGEAYLTSEFSQDKGALIDRIDKISIGSATRYDPPLLDKRWGAFELLKNKNCDPPEAKRIIIFLTDGDPNPPGPVDSVIEKGLSDLGAIFYAITAFQGMNSHLQRWADKSGGKAFVADGDDAGAKLLEIYRRIAAELQGKTQCFLEWTSPLSCDEGGRKRKVDVTLKKNYNLFSTTSYTAPPSSVLKLTVNPSIVYFDDPAPGVPVTKTVTIKATNGKVTLTKGSIIPNGGTFQLDPSDWQGDTPITLDSGDSVTFKIIFTQIDPKAFRQGSFLITGNPCDPPVISLVAGLSQVRLITPGQNPSDSVYSSCDDLLIQWAGVKPEDSVLIQYSTDKGKTWLLLKENATGLSYVWSHEELQKIKLDSYRVFKVKVLIPPNKQFIWAEKGGGVQNDSTSALSLTDDGLYINICGTYQGANATFGSKQLSSNGGSVDGFVAHYDMSGQVVWAISFGGAGEDRALGVVSTPGDVAFVTGYYTGDALIGGAQRQPYDKGVKNYFLGRISSGGSIPYVYDGTKSKQNITGESYGLEIAYEPSENRIYVHGKYKGRIVDESNPTFALSQSSGNGANFDDFTAVHDYTGALLDLRRGVDLTRKYSSLVATDKDGCIYETRKFSDPTTKGAFNLTSTGGTDYYITKFCGLPASQDSSIDSFRIGKPKLVSTDANIVFNLENKVAVGNSNSEILKTSLCNYGTLKTIIEDVVFSNPEFSSASSKIGLELDVPNCEFFDIEVNFAPKTLDPNPHCSDITFFATCSEPVKITVCAEATEPCTFTKTDIDFPNTLEGVGSEMIVKTFCNTSKKIINGKLTMEGANPGDFEIVEVLPLYPAPIAKRNDTTFTLKPDSCLTVRMKFKPKSAGGRNALLNYNIPSDCGDAQSILTGIGIAPLALEVSPQTWACTRPNVKDTQSVNVKNIGTGDATIKSITARTGTNFRVISTLPAAPVTAGGSFQVSVEFTPPSVGTFTDDLDVVASSTSGDRTFSNTLTGDGCLPVVKLDKECFTLTALGGSTTIPNAITITNTSNDVPLNISSITVLDPNAGEFINFTPPPYPPIGPNSPMLIQATFKPVQAGNRTAKVVVISDGVPGRDTIDVCGTAFAPDTSHTFGNLLTCQDSSWTYNYPNTSAADIVIDVTNSNSNNYIVTTAISNTPIISGQVTIPPKGLDFNIKFKPSGVGVFPGSVLLDKTNIQVSGEGKVVPVNFFVTPDSSSPTRLNPGEVAKITVKAEVLGTLEDSKLDTLVVDFTFDKKLFELAPFSEAEPIESLLTGWKWSHNSSTLGNSTQIKVTGVGPRITTAGIKDLFVVNLTSYLGDTLLYHVGVNGSVPSRLAGCVPTTSKGTLFDMANICFKGGRLISVGTTYYQLNAPKPSPASNEAKFEYGIGLSGMTEITLHNSLGELVQTLVRERQEAGTYEITLDATALPSGVYFYILHSGPYMEQQRLYIAK